MDGVEMCMQPLQFIKADSILGLRPTGVEKAPDFLLKAGLGNLIPPNNPLIKIPNLNRLYNSDRDITGVINAQALCHYSETLITQIRSVIDKLQFPVVLGGDCSILLGVMAALKMCGDYGLITFDAHADFYASTESLSGEAADMEIALVTGRGPDLLTDINGLKPYVIDKNVIHIGQRDEEETIKYGSQQIQQTGIQCFSLREIELLGIENTAKKIGESIICSQVQGYWIHFDVDVLNDEDNPAVDYRLPGGLTIPECEALLKHIFSLQRTVGISISIYNPLLDEGGYVGNRLAELLCRILKRSESR